MSDVYKGVGGWDGAGGGRGGREVVGVGGRPNVGYSFYQDTDSGAVFSVRDRNRYNAQDRQRQLLAV